MQRMATIVLTLLLTFAFATPVFAGPYEDGLKIVNDPKLLATRMGDAKKSFRDAARADGKNAHAWYNLGLLHQMSNELKPAAEAWRNALKADPKYLPASARLAELDYHRGNREAATATLERIITDSRYQAEARNILAGIAIEAKDWDAAIKHSRNVLLGDPENVNAYANLALVYFRQGLVDQAWLIATNAIERVPNAAALHNILGLIYLKRDDSRNAANAFIQALEANPRQIEAKLNLATLELSYGDFENALKRFDEVLELRPDDPMVVVSRAVALRGLERYEDAQKGYEKAIELKAGLPSALYNLCVLHQQYTNKYALALRYCQEFQATLTKSDKKYREMTKRVRSIEATIEALAPDPEEGGMDDGGAGDPGAEGAPAEGGGGGDGADTGGGDAGDGKKAEGEPGK